MGEALTSPVNQQEELVNESLSTKSLSVTIAFLFRLRRLLGIVIFLLIWEICGRTGVIDSRFLPPFSVVITTFFKMLASGEMITHMVVSLRRSLLGFGLGLLIAVPLGFLIGSFKKIDFYIDPLLQLFRQTSAIALLPAFMLFFGIAESSKIAIVFWGVWAPILLNTINGVKGVDPILIKAARSMGASQLTIFKKVIFPSAFPSIITGMRLSATTAILILIVAEMMGASEGLGYLLYDTQLKYQIPRMYAIIITMSFIGITVNYLLVALEKRVSRWKL
jgi:NitT/TauT family transport system permease protein